MLELGTFYLPSIIPLGKPFSQLLGVFQGRADSSSESVVAQPLRVAAATKSSSRNSPRGLRNKSFMSLDRLEWPSPPR